MKISKRTFGVLSDGQEAFLYTISNREMSFSVTNYGCCITSIMVPSDNGRKDDVALGFSTLDGYIKNSVFFGCIVGRFANRIAGGTFTIDDTNYSLEKNDNGNCLHSGTPGYHKMLWKAKPFCKGKVAGVVFSRMSPDGEQGFPGEVDLTVTYSLTTNNDIFLNYSAQTDTPTPINLTNHTYFNLNGHDSGSILGHTVQLFADRYVPVDTDSIPLGKTAEVDGTPFDFRTPKKIARDIESVPGGFDHTWEITPSGELLSPVAGVFEPVSNRSLTVYSTQPGVQFYTGNHLVKEEGKNGFVYTKQTGLCLETQHFPDSPNQAEFPNAILLPGELYEQQTIWHFDF